MSKLEKVLTMIIVVVASYIGIETMMLAFGYVFLRKEMDTRIKKCTIFVAIITIGFFALSSILIGNFTYNFMNLVKDGISSNYYDMTACIQVFRGLVFVAIGIVSALYVGGAVKSLEKSASEKSEKKKNTPKETKPAEETKAE